MYCFQYSYDRVHSYLLTLRPSSLSSFSISALDSFQSFAGIGNDGTVPIHQLPQSFTQSTTLIKRQNSHGTEVLYIWDFLEFVIKQEKSLKGKQSFQRPNWAPHQQENQQRQQIVKRIQ